MRLREADRVAGEGAVGEELAHFVDAGVRERQDVVRGHKRVIRHRRARVPHQAYRRAEDGAERGVVVLLDRSVQLGVERGQLARHVGVNLELTLAENPDDHDPSPACGCSAACVASEPLESPLALASICRGEPAASSPFICASSASIEVSAPSLSSSAWMASGEPPAWSSSAPEASSSSIAPARACICAVLSSARWIARPMSPISSEMPEKASLMRVCASAAVYVALMVSFLVRKASTLACSRCEASVSFSSCSCSWAYCTCRSLSWPCRLALFCSAARARSSRPFPSASRAWFSRRVTSFCSEFICSSTRLRDVATSATPRLTRVSISTCCW